MRDQEVVFVQESVANELMPEIKAALPKVLQFLLSKIFPKLEDRIVDFIVNLFTVLLIKRK